jgi:hypothetical protein
MAKSHGEAHKLPTEEGGKAGFKKTTVIPGMAESGQFRYPNQLAWT